MPGVFDIVGLDPTEEACCGVGRATEPLVTDSAFFSSSSFDASLATIQLLHHRMIRQASPTGSDGAELAGLSVGRLVSGRRLRLHQRTQDDEDGFTGESGAGSRDFASPDNASLSLAPLSSRSSDKAGETGRDDICGAFVRAASRHRTSASMRGEPSLRVMYLYRQSSVNALIIPPVNYRNLLVACPTQRQILRPHDPFVL